jgi:hypothetical protein
MVWAKPLAMPKLMDIISYQRLELVEHIPRVPWCIASATDGFYPGEIRSIEHAHDSLAQACAVVSIGVSDIGVAMMDNKKALFLTFVNHVPQFEAY